MEPTVTVLIPSYNPGMYLREALRSLIGQSHQAWRCFILDDASTDDSLIHAKDLICDERITLIQNPTNIGQAMTLNRGLKEVTTDFFLQLDADDWLKPHALDSFVRASIDSSPDVALIISNVIEYDEATGRERTIRQVKWGGHYANHYQTILANLFPWQKFYRTDAIRSVGGWPHEGEEKWRNVEDLGIFLRLIPRYRFIWIDEALYYYRIHKSNITRDRDATAAGVEWLIRDALRQWGDDYQPIFQTTADGWKMLSGLLSRYPD